MKLNKPQGDIVNSSKARNLYHSGQGGGKTFIMGVLSYNFVTHIPEATGLVAANTYGQLSDSTLVEIFAVWEKLGWTEFSAANPDGFYIFDKQPPSHFKPHGFTFKSNANKIYFKNGAVIMLASLDSYKNIEGRTLAWAMLDETSDTKEEAVKEVITARLRQPTVFRNKVYERLRPFVGKDDPNKGEAINPLYIFTKPAKEQWLTDFFNLEDYRDEIEAHIYSKEDYFLKRIDNKCIVIASTFHNQDNLPRNYITDRLKELTEDKAKLLIYGSPFGKSGNEYYANFKHEVHVQPVGFDPRLPLHLSFDFNVNPYMTGKVWQVMNRADGTTEVRNLKEYCLKAPNNTIEAVCRAFLRDYGDKCSAGFFYYGDASGKNRQPTEVLRDYFSIVERELDEVIFMNSRRLLRQNPRHRSLGKGTLGRREFINGLLAGRHNVKIMIDPECKETIADYSFLLEDANGAKLKQIVRENGISFEKYGHTSDADDAILCYLFGNYAKER